MDARSASEFVSKLWRLCEPTQENPFAALDRLLIRSALQKAFKATHILPATRAKKRFSQFIKLQVLAGLQPKSFRSSAPDAWSDFLTDLRADQFDIMSNASKTDAPDHPWHIIQVVSRAFLLLRVSTGLAEEHIAASSTSPSNSLSFWTNQVGEDRGLWAKQSKPPQITDLWIDAEDAIHEFESGSANVDSYNALWKTMPASAEVLSGSERICLWGLRL